MAARTFVALDLETTGLEVGRDRITEVGMVRFTHAGVDATYDQLVNPGREIPLRIQQLTGITNADVRDAPHFNGLRLEIEEFLGQATIVGQNIGFDLAFLAAAGLTPPGDVIDTLELATLLEPQHRRQSLAALAERHNVPMPSAHRALADAETTRGVFLALDAHARTLPPALVQEVIALGEGMTWSPATLLRDIAVSNGARTGAPAPLLPSPRERRRPPVPLARPPAGDAEPGAPPAGAKRTPARPPRLGSVAAAPLDETALAVLAAGGRNQEPFGAWEERPEQVGMTRAVARALDEGGQLLVEAGTGTGKSLAYLIPVALRALATGTRALVSTNTLNLQEQLIAHDVPATRLLLRDALGDEAADALAVAPLKGRRNYLCLRRVAQERAAASRAAPAAGAPLTSAAGSAASRLLARLLVWLRTTESGDRAEFRLGPDEESAWSYFSAEGEDCLSGGVCPYVRDGSCFLLRARRAAERAHVVVVNHALLLSDMAAGGAILPAAESLIIDEAHHLEDAATQHLGRALRVTSFTDVLERLHRLGPRGADQGVVGALAAALAAAPSLAAQAELEHLRLQVPPLVATAAAAVEEFFIALRRFAEDHAREANATDERLRLTRGVRAQPAWSDIERRWEEVFTALRAVDEALAALQEALAEVATLAAAAAPAGDAADTANNWDGLGAEIAGVRATLSERCERCGDLLTRHDAATVTWLALGRRSEFAALHAAPLQVGGRLAEGLFGRRRATVLTGATLTTDNTFDYLQERLALPDAALQRFGSPFDYRRAVRLLLPTDMPTPGESGYGQALEESLIDLTLASDGRALALFTSHGALRAAARGVRGPLEDAGIVVLAQGLDGSPARVLNALRENPRSLVLGTASLWEGVDVPGDTVSLLVIARLPFAVPTDPVYAARSDEYENPFARYAVPQAIVRFRQGFGRLIRRKDDRGVFVVLDGRLLRKRYGEAFLRSLPPLALQKLPRHALAGGVSEWLDR